MKKVLFLDIDGVLNSLHSCYIIHYHMKTNGYGLVNSITELIPENIKWDPLCVLYLKNIVEATKCDIVISSTWRLHLSPDIFVKMFDVYDFKNAPVIGNTTREYSRYRGSQVKEWLLKNPEYTKYAILDDDSDFLDEQKEYFVQTDQEYGLSLSDAERAISILNG